MKEDRLDDGTPTPPPQPNQTSRQRRTSRVPVTRAEIVRVVAEPVAGVEVVPAGAAARPVRGLLGVQAVARCAVVKTGVVSAAIPAVPRAATHVVAVVAVPITLPRVLGALGRA